MRTRSYDKEFKLNAVALYKSGKSQAKICRDLGIPGSTFAGWIKEDSFGNVDIFRGSGKVKASDEELTNIKKMLEDVTLERDILKKALAIFSRQK